MEGVACAALSVCHDRTPLAPSFDAHQSCGGGAKAVTARNLLRFCPMRASVQMRDFKTAILVKTRRLPMMFVNARCNNAGPLGKPIRTRSFAAYLFACLNTPITRLRW